MSPTLTPTAIPLAEALQQSLTPKIAVSYLRVSTREQAERGGDSEGFSIPAQREANKHKALSLGAIVLKEFVDRGASARSANRPELQRMLEYVNENPVDYVIVHKLDRLARNRVDDVEINQALLASKVRLVSTTESIDETPSGMLLHGIMSSIAEFYSRNLANEVMKGMTQKARGGGTVGRAPLGYRNIRTVDAEGREARTVVLDEERAPLIRLAFELYATGDWSVQALAVHLNDRGLTTMLTPRMASKPLSDTFLYGTLTNPYYKGLVQFQGAAYPGQHEPLVDAATWQTVQDVIASHTNGERTREHPHFLKSTIYCGSCGERLLVQIAKARSGMRYPYFMCAGRHSKRNHCQQKSVLIYEVEKKIEEHYERIVLDPEFRKTVEAMLLVELKAARADAEAEQRNLVRERDKLERQRDKLMEAHYAGAIPVDLLKTEQERIATGMLHITSRLDASNAHFDVVESNLKAALDLTEHCARAYVNAPDHIKKLFNQAFFNRILVNPDTSVNAELAPPFDTLLGPAVRAAATEVTTPTQSKEPAPKGGLTTASKPSNRRAPGASAFTLAQGLSKTLLVELRGLEPLTFSMRTRRATSCATAP